MSDRGQRHPPTSDGYDPLGTMPRDLNAYLGEPSLADAGPVIRGGAEDAQLSALFANLQGELTRERGLRAWFRGRPTWVRRAIGLGMVVGVAALYLAVRPRPDLNAAVLLRMGAFALLAGAAATAALRPIHRNAGPRWRSNALLALALLVPTMLMFLPAPLSEASRAAGAMGGLVPLAFKCFAFGSVIALPIVAVIAALDRGGQRISTILLAASAGLAANLLLENKCLISDPAHLILGHAPVIALYVLVAAGITELRRRR